MIFVNRPDPPESVKLALSKRGRFTRLSEIEAALWFFEGVKPEPADPRHVKPQQAPDYKVYKHDEVKEALNDIFGGHCAYCESRYAHIMPMDVEHYRPKGAIVEPDGTKKVPGYYWLAASWNNLLPSCILCNRENSQELMHADGSRTTATTGKGNFFPILAGTARASKQGEEADEDPLLLNPCNPSHNPPQHLLFRSDGLVEPRKSPEELAKPRGLATIETCALHRSTLVEVRREEATLLRNALAGILRADANCRDYPTSKKFLSMLEDEEAELALLITKLHFRAMTRELLELFAMVRKAVNEYYHAWHDWLANKTQAKNDIVRARAGELYQIYEMAGLHKSFVTELLKIASIPIRNLSA